MADKQSPFSSFLKNLGDPKFIQDLGDAAAKAIDAATKAIENITKALDASEDKRKGENHTAKPKQANAQANLPITPSPKVNKTTSSDSNIRQKSPHQKPHSSSSMHATSTPDASKPQNKPLRTAESPASYEKQSDGANVPPKHAQNNIKGAIPINDTVSDIQFKFPENATSTSCTPMLLPNGLHIRQYQWYQPATYQNAWEAHDSRPDQEAGWRVCDVLTDAYSDQQTLIIDKPEHPLAIKDEHYAFHIAPYAFLHAPHLKYIIFKTPNTSIDDRAFAGHKLLKSVFFEQSVSRIGKKSFYACSTLPQAPSQIQNDFSEITGPVLKAITNAFQNLKTNVITQSHSLLDNLKNASALSSESGFQFTQGNYGVKRLFSILN